MDTKIVAIIAGLFFGGNYTQARELLHCQVDISCMLSISRYSRRLHRIKPFF